MRRTWPIMTQNCRSAFAADGSAVPAPTLFLLMRVRLDLFCTSMRQQRPQVLANDRQSTHGSGKCSESETWSAAVVAVLRHVDQCCRSAARFHKPDRRRSDRIHMRRYWAGKEEERKEEFLPLPTPEGGGGGETKSRPPYLGGGYNWFPMKFEHSTPPYSPRMQREGLGKLRSSQPTETRKSHTLGNYII